MNFQFELILPRETLLPEKTRKRGKSMKVFSNIWVVMRVLYRGKALTE